MTRIDRVRCEYLDEPLGVAAAAPRLSWVLASDDDRRDIRQESYQVVVSSTPEALAGGHGDLWASDRVEGDETFGIVYGGRALRPLETAYWQVLVWCGDPDPIVSAPARWEAALDDAGWADAKWITRPRPVDVYDDHRPSPFLRRPFTVAGHAARARVMATAGGIYELWLNGHKVSTDRLTPGWTDYRKRVQFETYDVTDLLVEGENLIGAVLADGWFAGYVGWFHEREFWGTAPVLRLVLDIEGDQPQRIVTDEGWQGAFGPILSADLLKGEVYDARRELRGWSVPGASDDGWTPAVEAAGPTGSLIPRRSPAVGVIGERQPLKVSQPVAGSQVLDFGQNLVGWVRLRTRAAAGTIVRLRHAEALLDDGQLYTENLRGARATDTYILSGDGEEVCEPRFTIHGFRYLEITGLPYDVSPDDVTAVVASSAVHRTGSFECSDPLVNRIYQNILWGEVGNFVEVPTDCPQRDERVGWAGDAQVFAQTACYIADLAAMYSKWLDDMVDGQKDNGAYPDFAPPFRESGDGAPGWGDAGVVVPWVVYLTYGDTRILEHNYPAMARWVDHIRSNNADLLWREAVGNNYGDWLAPGETAPKDVVSTAYFAQSTQIVARAATILGKKEDADLYDGVARGIAQAFRTAFVAADGSITGDAQTGYALALRFGLLDDGQRRLAAAHLAANVERLGHLTTGFLGIGHLLPALSDTGRLDLAYLLLRNDSYPSWGYAIKHGATTIWERWDGWTEEKGFQDPGMNSFNHYSLGSHGQWLFEVAGGIAIDPEQAGFRHALIWPRPGGGLTWAKTSHESMVGPYSCEWQTDEDRFTVRVSVPPNGKATVVLPGTQVTESGSSIDGVTGVRSIGADERGTLVEVGSGTYEFSARARS